MTSRSEDGFTFVEVLAALAIISLSAFLLGSALRGGMAAVEKIQNRNDVAAEISRLEFLFREEIGKLGPAWWEEEYGETYQNLYEKDGVLCLVADDSIFTFRHLKLENLEQSKLGITAALETDKGMHLEIKALYGSFAVTGNDDEK